MKDFKHHEHCGEALKREKPTLCGEVDTTGMGEYYSMHKPHPHCGYEIPPFKPLFVPGMSPQEQTQVIAKRVDELTKMLCDYSEKVYGAYEDIVHSAICNDAYYSEIETETGYLSATSAKYTVVHIPFIDRAGQPIYLQLGTAYDNTTNSGLHEGVFSCSEKKIADKLIPAFNITDKWTGKARWKGAPIPSESGKFTLGVLRNGFFKIYNQTATDADMNKDDVVNAMGVQGVLVSGGAKATDSYDENTKDKVIGRVGLGMNFSTQERIIILVDGEQAEGVTSGGGCTSDQLAELFIKYGCTVAVETANGATTCMLDKGELVNIPYENMNTRSDSEDKIPYEPAINCYWYITKKRHYHNDYVREVGELMQKYGYAVWKSIVEGKAVDALRDEVKNVWNALNQEIDDREKADQTLQTNIDNLSDHVDEIYSELKEADKTLDEKIDRVNDALEKEVQDRTNADTELDTKFTNALNKEISDREDAVTGLDEKYATAVAKEIADRKEADENLDTKFTKAVTDEATERKSGDTALDTKFTKALETETTARESADTELDNKIATETTNRTNADSALNEKINTETTERKTADTDITASITQLKNDYESFKTSTNADLATKKEQIDNILADIATVKTNISDLQAAQSQIDNTFTQIMKTLSEMEQSFENLKQTVTNLQASWEQYKTTWEATWTQYESNIESAFEEFKNAVNTSLAAYVPLAGTEEDKFITGMVVAKGTAEESNVGFEVGATDSKSDTKVLANKITLDDGTDGYYGIDLSSSTDTTNGKVLVVGTGENHEPVYINNVKEPKADLDVANKKYVDGTVEAIDLSNYYKKDGSESATAFRSHRAYLVGDNSTSYGKFYLASNSPSKTGDGSLSLASVMFNRGNKEALLESVQIYRLKRSEDNTTQSVNGVMFTPELDNSVSGIVLRSNKSITKSSVLYPIYKDGSTVLKVGVYDIATPSVYTVNDVEIVGVATPTNDASVANKKYVDDKVAGVSVTGDYVPLSGTETDKPITGSLILSSGYYSTEVSPSGSLTLSSSGGNVKISPVKTNPSDPVTSVKFNTGINVNVKLTGIADPDRPDDVANKNYVDKKVAGISVTGDYVPLSGTETDKPITGDLRTNYTKEVQKDGVNYNVDLEKTTTPTQGDYLKIIDRSEGEIKTIQCTDVVTDYIDSMLDKSGVRFDETEIKVVSSDENVLSRAASSTDYTAYKRYYSFGGQLVHEMSYEEDNVNASLVSSVNPEGATVGCVIDNDSLKIELSPSDHTIKFTDSMPENTPCTLKNVAMPTENSDAATKEYVDDKVSSTSDMIKVVRRTFGSPVAGSSLASGNVTADYNIDISDYPGYSLMNYTKLTGSYDIELQSYLQTKTDGSERIVFRFKNNGSSVYTITEKDGVLLNLIKDEVFTTAIV